MGDAEANKMPRMLPEEAPEAAYDEEIEKRENEDVEPDRAVALPGTSCLFGLGIELNCFFTGFVDSE